MDPSKEAPGAHFLQPGPESSQPGQQETPHWWRSPLMRLVLSVRGSMGCFETKPQCCGFCHLSVSLGLAVTVVTAQQVRTEYGQVLGLKVPLCVERGSPWCATPCVLFLCRCSCGPGGQYPVVSRVLSCRDLW